MQQCKGAANCERHNVDCILEVSAVVNIYAFQQGVPAYFTYIKPINLNNNNIKALRKKYYYHDPHL